MHTPSRTESQSWPGLLPAMAFLLAGGVLGFTEARTLSGQGLAFVEDPTRLLVYGGAYSWALAWLIAHPKGVARLATAVWPWCVLLAYVLASSLWSPFPLKVIVNFGHLAGGTLVAAAAVLAVQGDGGKLAGMVIFAFGLVLALSLAAVLAGVPNAFDLESGRWAGTTGNANTLGSVAAIVCWAATYCLLTAPRVIVKLSATMVWVLGAVVLLGSGSATSLVVGVLMSGGTCWLLLGRKENSSVVGRTLVGLALAAVSLAVAMTFAPELLGMEKVLQVLGRSATLSGRTELWALGWDRFLERPLAGYGFDSLAALLSGAAMQVGQLHNGYLDLLIQGGAIAGVLFVVLTARSIRHAFVLARRGRTESVMCLLFILGALAHNVTESSIARPVTNLWFLFVLAVLTLERHRSWRDAAAPVATHDHHLHRPARLAPLPNLLR